MEGTPTGMCEVTEIPLRRSGTREEEDKAKGAVEGERIEGEDKVEKTKEDLNGDPGEDKLEENLAVEKGEDKTEGGPEVDKEKVSLKRKRETSVSITKDIPRGRPKSGRVWKENKKRFSDMVKDRPLRTSWDIKMKERQEKKLVKSLAQQLKDEKQREKDEKRKRREENLRRRLENERKAEIVQVIRNPAKLKRARRKQLRNIEKRDTLMMSEAGKKLSQKKTAPSKK